MEITKQKNYQQSFDLACTTIKGMNLEERAKKAGADYQKGEEGEKIIIHFFSEPYHIHFPQIGIQRYSRRPALCRCFCKAGDRTFAAKIREICQRV
jgi:hypothetical protein